MWGSDEGLTLKTSALKSLYCGQITFINSADKTKINIHFVQCSLTCLKGKHHENMLSFQNPKMFDCQQKQ